MENYTVETKVAKERVADLLANALETSAISYWGSVHEMVRPKGKKAPQFWSSLPIEGGTIVLWDQQEDKKHVLGIEKIREGLQAWAQGSPASFGRFMDQQDDNTDADLFIQYCLFGKVIYG